MTTCPSCGQQVPEGSFCVRCGTRLAEGGRRGFAAAPNQRPFVPRVISTLFPQLPKHDTRGFEAMLVVGVIIVLGLGVAGLYPVAVIAAALLVPILTVLYLYDVDVYEDEPFRVVAFTMAWGAVAGIAVGLIARTGVGSTVASFTQSRVSEVVPRGILLPLLSTALMLAGPLVLLPYRRFNDVLDGATFGGASAVWFVGAAAIVQALGFLDAGLRPVGRVLPWIQILLETAVLRPVLAAAAVGAASGAFWLRYRAPARDRDALGILGGPFVATGLAVLFEIVAAVAQVLWPGWPSLIVVAVLTPLALIWLRVVIHVGLVEESAEIAEGPEITCANCGQRTPRVAFCKNCGISLLALPKTRPAGPLAPEEAGS
jgi:hypothetical protein